MAPTVETMRKKLSDAGLYPLRHQADTAMRVLKERLDTLVPLAMQEAEIDFWVVLAAEYNEDPLMRSLFAWDMPTARRVSVLMFHKKPDGTVRRMSAGARSPMMEILYENILPAGGDVWEHTVNMIKECDPARIGIDKSGHFGMCDGLSSTMYEKLLKALPTDYHSRLQSAEALCVAYLQRITTFEEQLIKAVVEVTQDIIDMAYTLENIVPGKTTTTDVEWLMRETISELDCDFWFGPDVDLQRKGSSDSRMADLVIQRGDLLHCDIGMTPRYVAVHSDIQRLAYVANAGEAELPQGLAGLMARGNRFQDIVMEEIQVDKSGNDIFTAAIKKGMDEGLSPMLYSHPLGTFGHGAGPSIGMYDKQKPIPVNGDYEVKANTCYALELNCCGPLPEWDNQNVYMYLEENIICKNSAEYIHGRQTEITFV